MKNYGVAACLRQVRQVNINRNVREADFLILFTIHHSLFIIKSILSKAQYVFDTEIPAWAPSAAETITWR